MAKGVKRNAVTGRAVPAAKSKAVTAKTARSSSATPAAQRKRAADPARARKQFLDVPIFGKSVQRQQVRDELNRAKRAGAGSVIGPVGSTRRITKPTRVPTTGTAANAWREVGGALRGAMMSESRRAQGKR